MNELQQAQANYEAAKAGVASALKALADFDAAEQAWHDAIKADAAKVKSGA